jgi:hypothetical protein
MLFILSFETTKPFWTFFGVFVGYFLIFGGHHFLSAWLQCDSAIQHIRK